MNDLYPKAKGFNAVDIKKAMEEAILKKTALILEPYRTPKEHPKYNWNIVRSYEEFIEYIAKYYNEHQKLPDLISFAHNLHQEHDKADAGRSLYSPIFYSNYKVKTGKHAAEWLVIFCRQNNILLNSMIAIHADMDKHISNIEFLINECKKQQGLKDTAFKMRWEYQNQ